MDSLLFVEILRRSHQKQILKAMCLHATVIARAIARITVINGKQDRVLLCAEKDGGVQTILRKHLMVVVYSQRIVIKSLDWIANDLAVSSPNTFWDGVDIFRQGMSFVLTLMYWKIKWFNISKIPLLILCSRVFDRAWINMNQHPINDLQSAINCYSKLALEYNIDSKCITGRGRNYMRDLEPESWSA
jgi:hypothetical protein